MLTLDGMPLDAVGVWLDRRFGKGRRAGRVRRYAKVIDGIVRAEARRDSMRLIVIIAGSLLLWACTGTPSPLEPIANEGLAIMKRVNFESPPEAKLQTAQELVTHASRYETLAGDPTTTTSLEAARFRHNERGAAATLMRDAADDYETHRQPEKARDVYQLILRTFTDAREAHIRQSADSELSRLSTGGAPGTHP